VREPIISLVEALCGKSCHLMANNAVVNAPGQAISTWHVDRDSDCTVEFPCPPGMARHDPRYVLPVLRLTVQIYLTDVLTVEDGPSQYIPGSHYSGRDPDTQENLTFEGRGCESVLGRAGDIYLHNGQCWHRGAPNLGKNTRYLLQMSYCQRWVAQRFYPFIDYKMPEHVWEGASDRLQRVLGRHPKGPYG
jgi:ectoine hydroxylase-related dioxygenase (phytanoyl-CoA dioxygenase family)